MDAGEIVRKCVVSISLSRDAASVGSVGKSLTDIEPHELTNPRMVLQG